MSTTQRDREQFLREHNWQTIGGEHEVPDIGLCWWIEDSSERLSAWVRLRDWRVHWHGGTSEDWGTFAAWVVSPKLSEPRPAQRSLFADLE